MGLPGDVEGQRRILSEGLQAAHQIETPGTIVDLGYRYVDDDWKASPMSWSRKRQDNARSGTDAGDTRSDRSADPVYQSEEDRLAADSVPEDVQCLTCLGLG